MVHLSIGDAEIIAHITRRATADLNLAPGDSIHAIIKATISPPNPRKTTRMSDPAEAPAPRSHPSSFAGGAIIGTL